MRNKLLEVENLSTRFVSGSRQTYAVNGVSFDIYAGETVAFVGESGSGKSVTMLSVLNLLESPPAEISAKCVRFEEIDLLNAGEDEMRAVRGRRAAMIFQDPMTSLNPVLSIGYQIMEPLMVHGKMRRSAARKKAEDLLTMVGIPEAHRRLRDFPYQFSGGMRQRVMIAMALSCEPQLLIADEPTTALDVTIQAQIIDLAKRLRDKLGMAMLWITHDLGVVAGLADRVNVMYGGFIVESAPVDRIFDHPAHPYTIALLRSLPSLDGDPNHKLNAIEGIPPHLSAAPVACPFADRCENVHDRCRKENPALSERSPRHSVACWLEPAGSRVS